MAMLALVSGPACKGKDVGKDQAPAALPAPAPTAADLDMRCELLGKTCGGHLMTDHPQWNLVDVYAGVIPTFAHKAGVHVHYQETVLHMHDGVAKMKDLPAEMGGSGQTLAE